MYLLFCSFFIHTAFINCHCIHTAFTLGTLSTCFFVGFTTMNFPHDAFKSAIAFTTSVKVSHVQIIAVTEASSPSEGKLATRQGVTITFHVDVPNSKSLQLAISSSLRLLSNSEPAKFAFMTRMRDEVIVDSTVEPEVQTKVLLLLHCPLDKCSNLRIGVVLMPASGSDYPISCTNGVKDPDETDVDCGGVCPVCPNGYMCVGDLDCGQNTTCHAYPTSQQFEQQILLAERANVGTKSETVVNAGEKNTNAVDVVLAANTNPTPAPTTPGAVLPRVCIRIGCTNGFKDGSETDVDCGGTCDTCGNFKTCASDADCTSSWCALPNSVGMRVCQPNSCFDEEMSGNETDVDCGGSCDKCPNFEKCLVNYDCESDFCNEGLRCDPGKTLHGIWYEHICR